jgi:hypothetical protein
LGGRGVLLDRFDMLMAFGIPNLILGCVTERGISNFRFHAAEFFCGVQNNEISKPDSKCTIKVWVNMMSSLS